MEADDGNLILTPAEAAKLLRLSELGYQNPEKTIRTWAARRRIECSHIGKRVVFTHAQIRSYLAREQLQIGARRRRSKA